MHNKELHNLYSLPNTVTVIKSTRDEIHRICNIGRNKKFNVDWIALNWLMGTVQ